VSNLCDELETRAARGEGVVDPSTPRIMYTGTPTAEFKLHHLIETSGGLVVCEDACSGSRFYRILIDEIQDGLEGQLMAISGKYLKADCAHFTPNNERIENIVRPEFDTSHS